ncbi:MAG: hypothetical protein QM759_15540 [Terricaulis sp.]
MVELAEGIVVASVAATFFSDIMSRSIKMMRGVGRRSNIQVADAEHSAH